MNKDITLEDKMVVMDVTDIMIIGGYGNVSGNLNLLQYSNDEIKEMIKENNDEEDNIRLIQSLLKTIRWQKQQIEEKDKIIDKLLSYENFEGDCPYSVYDFEVPLQDEIMKICDCENCQDDYKKCWLKYFENEIERGKE